MAANRHRKICSFLLSVILIISFSSNTLAINPIRPGPTSNCLVAVDSSNNLGFNCNMQASGEGAGPMRTFYGSTLTVSAQIVANSNVTNKYAIYLCNTNNQVVRSFTLVGPTGKASINYKFSGNQGFYVFIRDISNGSQGGYPATYPCKVAVAMTSY